MTSIEVSDSSRATERTEIKAILRNQYPMTDSKRRICKRLHDFLRFRRDFEETELEAYIYRERFLLSPKVRLSRFVRGFKTVMLEELTRLGYLKSFTLTRKTCYEVMKTPSLEEIEEISETQIFDRVV
jgi:hypothetical protein